MKKRLQIAATLLVMMTATAVAQTQPSERAIAPAQPAANSPQTPAPNTPPAASVQNPSTPSAGRADGATPAAPAAPPATGAASPAAPANPPAGQPPVVAVPAAPVVAPKKAKVFNPADNCVGLDDAAIELESGRRPPGGPIVFDTYFLPAGGSSSVDVGLDQPFVDGARYFAYVNRDRAHRLILGKNNVSSRKAADNDALVKKGALDKDRTIVNLRIADSVAGFWKRADLYIYSCGTNGSPAQVSRAATRLSSSFYSGLIAWIVVAIAYLVAGFAYRSKDSTGRALCSYANPVKITAGNDGKASLAKFQILFFSLIVFGLILFLVLRTGVLSEISSTVLLLLGITGLGSTMAKGADAQRSTITPENRAWLLRKGWLPAVPTVGPDNAAWRDLFTTDKEFDVYRYQSFIFSLAVGGALIAGGVAQLASFTIPETLLGILGLSQAVYIGGKLVTPTSIADLNKAITGLKESERKLIAGLAVQANRPATFTEAVTLVGQNAYDAYMNQAIDAATLFSSVTGTTVDPKNLQPSLGVPAV